MCDRSTRFSQWRQRSTPNRKRMLTLIRRGSLSPAEAKAVASRSRLPGSSLTYGDLLAAMPDVPFGCYFRRAVDLSHREPCTEITV
jgi:hypothetical protein